MTRLFSIALVLIANISVAGTLTCSSADQRLSLHEHSPDGGAFALHTKKLTLDGIELVTFDDPSKPVLELATYKLHHDKDLITQVASGHHQTSYFAQTLIVVSKDLDPKILFEDIVLCKQIRYTGPPRPIPGPGPGK